MVNSLKEINWRVKDQKATSFASVSYLDKSNNFIITRYVSFKLPLMPFILSKNLMDSSVMQNITFPQIFFLRRSFQTCILRLEASW